MLLMLFKNGKSYLKGKQKVNFKKVKCGVNCKGINI
jgi:hypothetical protein